MSYAALNDKRTERDRRSVGCNLLTPDCAIRTQAEVARIVGITRGGVSEIENRAFRKMFLSLRADPVLRQAFRDMTGFDPEPLETP